MPCGSLGIESLEGECPQERADDELLRKIESKRKQDAR